MSNLPPGCTEDDIDRHAEGSCPDCGKTLRDGYCLPCDSVWCDKCERMLDSDVVRQTNSGNICEKCAEQAEDQQTESEET